MSIFGKRRPGLFDVDVVVGGEYRDCWPIRQRKAPRAAKIRASVMVAESMIEIGRILSRRRGT